MFGRNTPEIGLSICPVGLRSANVSLATALDTVQDDSDQNNQEHACESKTKRYQDDYSSGV